MKKSIAFILASASATAIAVPASAQDNSAFTGPRIEGIAGYDISKAGSDVDNDLNDEDDQSIDGFMYGVGIGYDFAVNNIVLGVEAELTDSTAKSEIDDGDLEDLGFGARLKTGRDLYLGARAGVLANPRTLIYVKGGYTNARFDLLADDGSTEIETDLDLDGFRVGAGAEYALSENSFVKLEYRYSNYSEGEFDFEDNDFFDDDTGESGRFDADLDRHQVAVGFGYRF
ncbi:membrane protein [Aurantiacibacter atlanticus]|uniref:Membrane protein n=1 Tax=Aurantiacibacter atlanticus TaxID=1648404 RepID=A0A0H4VB94_9SPHN|nr:porin family protein [Aurantiacibacter atlanticus]AKQ41902.1 membrane protein [Aurantiacibacter atlanticus]MDF1833998.1 porin family protein [Alteraurantiacibacter sp. bin_em_oilr2.035]